MKAGEKTTVSRPLPVWRFWGLALFVAFVFGTLWVSPVQAETDTGKKSKIIVRKFEDKNGNGNKDSGEGWLNDWTFTLSDSGGNTIGSGSTSGSGSSAGSLIFGNLVSGTYTVTETLQNGYLSTTGLNQSVSLGSAETKEIKFGNAKLAEICIYKFKDLDGDGAKDEGEPYLPNWTFKL